MTLKINMLTAAAVLALPAAASAQLTGSVGAGAQVNIPTQSTLDRINNSVQQTQDQVNDTVDETQDTVQDTVDQATDTDVNADASAQANAGASAGPVTAATAADVHAGAAVLDASGSPVGTIESVDAEGAVISTGKVRAKLPLSSFGKNNRGLVIAMTKTQLEAAASAQSPS